MSKHRNPHPKVSKQRPADNFDYDEALYALRDNIGRADALVTAVEDLIERTPSDDEDDENDETRSRRRNHVAHLLEDARLAVQAAEFASGEIERRRR